jgi:hypothetical protein
MSLTPRRLASLGKAYLALAYYHPAGLADLGRWMSSLRPGRSAFTDERPWVTFPAQAWLEEVIKPTMHIFEYGAGGSTIYFSKRVASVITVEHDDSWHRSVKDVLSRMATDQHRLIFVPPERLVDGRHTHYLSESWPGWSFEAYVRTIDKYSEETFDLVLIDGRARSACIRQAMSKIRRGGYLMVDNTDQLRYQRALKWLDRWTRQDFPGLVPYTLDPGLTSVWRRSFQM